MITYSVTFVSVSTSDLLMIHPADDVSGVFARLCLSEVLDFLISPGLDSDYHCN